MAAKGPEGWAEYRSRYVDPSDPERYIEAVGGAERISAIPPPVF